MSGASGMAAPPPLKPGLDPGALLPAWRFGQGGYGRIRRRKIEVNSVPLSLTTASELLRSATIKSGSRSSLATDSCGGFDYRNWRGFDYRHRRNTIPQNSLDDWEDGMKTLEGMEGAECFAG